MLLLPQYKDTPLHNADEKGQHESVHLLFNAKANADAANKVSGSPRSVTESCRIMSCVVVWSHRARTPRYTVIVLFGMDTVSQCGYYSLRRPMLMPRTESVTYPVV